MARRQEQEPASEEVTELARGVLRMQLPVTFPGLGHVNCYALLDSQGAAVVDPGLPGAESWHALERRLAQAGLAPRHVHTVIVTHSHPDHFGGASRLRRESGARILAHRDFSFGPFRTRSEPEASVDDLGAQRDADARSPDEPGPPSQPKPRHSPWRALRRARTPWGGRRFRVSKRMALRWAFMHFVERVAPVPTITDPVADGEILELGGRSWAVVHTPGHTRDHFCLHDPDAGILLAGDHVLPTITPHISGMSASPDPLAGFFDSLQRVADMSGVELVLPAHGHPFSDLPGRAEAIRHHHEKRLSRIEAIGSELGAASVEEFSHRLFAPRNWGMMAESETYAHLEHLRLTGRAECHRRADGALLFETG